MRDSTWIFLFFLAVYSSAINPQAINANDATRLATVQSLVEEGTFWIENSKFSWTVDKMWVGDHAISDKPPFFSVLGAAAYYILYNVFEVSFSSHPFWAYFCVTFATVSVSSAALMAFFYESLAFTKIKHRSHKLFLVFSLGFGTLVYTYSSVYNNHTFTAATLYAGFYYLLKTRFKRKGRARNMFLCGVFAGITFLSSLPEFMFPLFFLAYFAWEKKTRKDAVAYVAPVLASVLVFMMLNVAVTGDFFPPNLHAPRDTKKLPLLVRYYLPEQFVMDGYWRNPQGIDALQEPKTVYAYNAFFGHHGFFSFTPILLVSLFFLLAAVVDRSHMFRREAVWVLASCSLTFLLIILVYNNYGGLAHGFRWFLPETPILFFFTAFFFEKRRSRAWIALYGLTLFYCMLVNIPRFFGPWTIFNLKKLSIFKFVDETVRLVPGARFTTIRIVSFIAWACLLLRSMFRR